MDNKKPTNYGLERKNSATPPEDVSVSAGSGEAAMIIMNCRTDFDPEKKKHASLVTSHCTLGYLSTKRHCA